jgi:hypothetical protein
MIWFPCKQCGKTHGRGADQSGTLVFCECGHGNRVPWTSTAPEPPAPPPEPPALPPPPRWKPEPVPDLRNRWQRGREPIHTDPDRCFNHQDQPRTANCEACGQAFCAACVVGLGGRTLCGPCKDFRVRVARRPPQMSWLAIFSLVLALVVAGPFSFCLPFASANAQATGAGSAAVSAVFGVIALVLPLTAMVLGVLALREIETKPNVGGRPTALTGTIAGAVGVLWCLAVYVAIVIKQAGG